MVKRILKLNPVREDQMQVTLVPKDGASSTGQAILDVNANDPAQAVQQATAQLPGKHFGQVTVGPKAANRQGSAPSPVAPAPGAVKPTNMLTPESTEINRFKYPYGIVVPRSFGPVISKAVRTGRTIIPGVMLGEAHGRVTVQIQTPAAMATFVARLSKARGPQARTILEGIKSSA